MEEDMKVRKHSPVLSKLLSGIAVGAAVVIALAAPAAAEPKVEYSNDQALFAAVYERNQKAVQELLAAGADANVTNPEGTPALFIAALQNDFEIARSLIKHGADVKRVSKTGRTALHVAASTEGAWKIAKLLIDAGADINVHDQLEGIPVIPVGSGSATPLIEAAKCRDARTLKLLIDRGADVNATERSGATALMAAAVYGNREAVSLLIAAHANVNATNKFGSTALALGTVRDDVEIVRMLLDAKATVNTADGFGSSPLMWAAYSESGRADIVDLLLKAGADVNVKNKAGENAMTWASRNGETDIVRRLRAAGMADVARLRPAVPRHEPVEIKQAVESALQALQKSGPEFVKKSGCTSCHHQNITAMATGMARRNGFSYDTQIAADQQKVVLSRLRPARTVLLEGADVVPEIPLTGGYMLLGLAAENYPFDANVDAVVRGIAARQMPDGSWIAWAPRPPLGSGYIRATAVAARALSLYTPPSRKREFEERISKARDFLRTVMPQTTEERTMQLLGLAWTHASKQDLERVASLLLKQQQADGGWSQLTTLETDAYATSHALIALHEAGILQTSDAAWKKGVDYLLRTQFPDGSWLVKTRSFPFQPLVDSGFPQGRDQWISASATGWAAMVLQLASM
jgi:ankyrin repeat protein